MSYMRMRSRGRRGLGADAVKVAEMSNMTKSSSTAAVPYTTTSMTKAPAPSISDTFVAKPVPVLTVAAPAPSPSIMDIFTPKPVPVLTVAPSMTDTYVAPKPASAAVPYTTPQTWAKDSVVTTQPSAVARTPMPTVQPTPTAPAPTRTLAPTVQPTYAPSPDYVAPAPSYSAPPSDGPRYPATIQPVSIIQPVLVPWADNSPGGRGGGGFKYPEEIPQGLEPTPIVITRPFPWWLVAVGVGAYLYMKKK